MKRAIHSNKNFNKYSDVKIIKGRADLWTFQDENVTCLQCKSKIKIEKV